MQEVEIVHQNHEPILHVVDHEGKSILRLHLKLSEPPHGDRTSRPHVSVLVAPAERYRSCHLRLLPPFVDETDPLDA